MWKYVQRYNDVFDQHKLGPEFVENERKLLAEYMEEEADRKEEKEKKRKKEENSAYEKSGAGRKDDKKKDDVEVEGQGLMLFEDEE